MQNGIEPWLLVSREQYLYLPEDQFLPVSLVYVFIQIATVA
jgi:hypothetical protein